MFEVIQRILLRAKPSSELYTSAIDQGAKLLGIDREVVIAQAFQELSLSKTPTVAMKQAVKQYQDYVVSYFIDSPDMTPEKVDTYIDTAFADAKESKRAKLKEIYRYTPRGPKTLNKDQIESQIDRILHRSYEITDILGTQIEQFVAEVEPTETRSEDTSEDALDESLEFKAWMMEHPYYRPVAMNPIGNDMIPPTNSQVLKKVTGLIDSWTKMADSEYNGIARNTIKKALLAMPNRLVDHAQTVSARNFVDTILNSVMDNILVDDLKEFWPMQTSEQRVAYLTFLQTESLEGLPNKVKQSLGYAANKRTIDILEGMEDLTTMPEEHPKEVEKPIVNYVQNQAIQAYVKNKEAYPDIELVEDVYLTRKLIQGYVILSDPELQEVFDIKQTRPDTIKDITQADPDSEIEEGVVTAIDLL